MEKNSREKMGNRNRLVILLFLLVVLDSSCRVNSLHLETSAQPEAALLPIFSYLVSMEDPATGRLQIVFRYSGIDAETVELKMPAWTPGYYRILNFARNVTKFKALSESGKSLFWEKVDDHTWKIRMSGEKSLVASYEVLAKGRGVAESQLSEQRAYLSPTSVFMYVEGKLDFPLKVTIKPHPGFKQISSGLEPAVGENNSFYAESFDILYDCPIYVGNQEILKFEVNGIPYEVAVDDPGDFDRVEIISALKRLVMTATSIVGEVPYNRYVFIMMGPGAGGLEHRNSMAVFTKIPKSNNRQEFQRWLSFIAHEFFHLYNVKAIRPMALGPFDYGKENRTNMLWFSEGGTVYYEYLILRRAGFMNREELLNTFSRIIEKVENSAVRRLESAAQASYHTWEEPFFGSDQTISYYDLGAILTMLFDLKIRHETEGRKCLDDVMKFLYERFYKEKRRGFADEEFKQVCQEVAGTNLSELFDYVYTTAPIDYNKYLGYAGLKLEEKEGENGRRIYSIKIQEELDGRQLHLLTGWL
ncbi:MAG: M61 family metallopeptidase [Candidatus Saccharicenans sp.]|uniref:M61 family metallopeptidase n=1 Tax=Candidatus Saccharicenans sp. TaxID=2819258 RepID=UPI00404941E7